MLYAGKAIPTRRAAMLARPARETPQPVELTKGSLKGLPPLLKEVDTPKLSSQHFELPEEPEEKGEAESPFEEPKVDEFGTQL